MLVVLSIVSTVAVIAVPTYSNVRQNLYQVECRVQLMEVGQGLERYRSDNGGQDPNMLAELAPKYLAPEKLVCPYVRARAPEIVAKLQEGWRDSRWPGVHSWASYYFYRRRALDELASKQQFPFSYTQILRSRRGATPVVICLDHREPFTLYFGPGTGTGRRELLASWYYPERPVILLRQSGEPDTGRFGGLIADGQQVGMLALAAHL